MLSTIKLSPQALAEFKMIYHEEFDEALSDDQAQEMAACVLRLFYLLSKPPVDPIH